MTTAQRTALAAIRTAGAAGLLETEIKTNGRKGRSLINNAVLRNLRDAGLVATSDEGDRYAVKPRASYLPTRSMIVRRVRLTAAGEAAA